MERFAVITQKETVSRANLSYDYHMIMKPQSLFSQSVREINMYSGNFSSYIDWRICSFFSPIAHRCQHASENMASTFFDALCVYPEEHRATSLLCFHEFCLCGERGKSNPKNQVKSTSDI